MAIKFPGILSAAALSASTAARMFLQEWLARHREAIITAIEQDNDAARAATVRLLHDLIEQNPATSGAILALMNQPPDQALAFIAMMDRDLADKLRPHTAAFARLQTEWKLSGTETHGI